MLKRLLTGLLVTFVLVGIFSAGQISAQDPGDLTYLTEHFPPYNFEADEEIQGITVDVLREVFERENIDAEIDLVPWAQGYDRVQTEENTVLFGTARTEEREDMFKWAGPVVTLRIGLIAREEDNIEIGDLDDLEDYTVGTVRDDVAELELLEAGISERNLDRSGEIEHNIEQLARGRIDLVAYTEDVFLYEAGRLDHNPEQFETVHVMADFDTYYAFHEGVSDAAVNTIQSAIDELKEEGFIEEVIADYVE